MVRTNCTYNMTSYMNIFDIHLEFDHDKFRDEINKAIVDKKVGYVCVVDGNVLSQHT